MTHPFVKTDYPLPQLELPNWLPRPVAEQAERLYDLELQEDPKYRPPHVAESMPQPLPPASGKRLSSMPSCVSSPPSERVRQKLDELKRRNDPLIQRFSEEERPFSQEQRSRLVASLKVLCRLTSDQRMDRVWRELYKKVARIQRSLYIQSCESTSYSTKSRAFTIRRTRTKQSKLSCSTHSY